MNYSIFFVVIFSVLSFSSEDFETALYMEKACPTKDETSPTLDGRIRVLFVRANLLNAPTYCSATVREAASPPFFCDSLYS